MCFKKPKMSAPKMTEAIPTPAPPIADQTPKVEDGTNVADTKKNKVRKAGGNSSLSLFQIQLIPGASAASAEDPGATTGGAGL